MNGLPGRMRRIGRGVFAVALLLTWPALILSPVVALGISYYLGVL